MPLKINKSKFPSMARPVIVYMAWSNIRYKKLRSMLTTAGIIIGIGSIYFLLSLGLGLQNLVTEEVIGSQSVKTIDVSSPNSSIIKLDEASATNLKRISNVDTVGGIYAGSGTASYGGSEVDAVAYGIDSSYQKLAKLNLSSGRLFDEKQEAKEVVINKAMLTSIGLGEPKKATGASLDVIILAETDEKTNEIKEKLRIVGVIDNEASSEIYVPASLYRQAGLTQYSQLKLVAKELAGVPELRKQIESLGLKTDSPLDTIEQIQQLFRYVNVILIGFGSIGMIVAILGMFNTLTISLLERTRELGLMVTLGVKNRDIWRQFIYESIILSAIGSVIGIVLATTAGQIVSVAMNRIASQRGFSESFAIFSFPWWLPILAVTGMLVIGLGVAFFPARRAEHVNPIDALRDQ